MEQIVIEYKHTSERGPHFLFPDNLTQMSNDMFNKAKTYGITLGLPFHLQIQGGRAHLSEEKEPGVGGESIIESKNGLLIIPMGLEIKVPNTYALFHIDLLRSTHNFVIDKKIKEWYRVNLYLLATHSYFEKGTPALKLLPIADTLYDFTYSRIL